MGCAYAESRWLRGLDSNQDNQLQRLACYQLHYPGTGYESVADLLPICYSEDQERICDCRRSVAIRKFAGVPLAPRLGRRLLLGLQFVRLLKLRRRRGVRAV